VLWVERDVPEPGREGGDYPSKRIQRTPKAGGKARTLTTADHPCGLWVSGDYIYFLGDGQRYQSTTLFQGWAAVIPDYQRLPGHAYAISKTP
jgi:hypothetical protein